MRHIIIWAIAGSGCLFRGLNAIDGHKGISCLDSGITCYTTADENSLICEVDMTEGTDSLFSEKAKDIKYNNMHGVVLWQASKDVPVCDEDPAVDRCFTGSMLFVADSNNYRVVALDIDNPSESITVASLHKTKSKNPKPQHMAISSNDPATLYVSTYANVYAINLANGNSIDTLNGLNTTKSAKHHGVCLSSYYLFVMSTKVINRYNIKTGETETIRPYAAKNKYNWMDCEFDEVSERLVLLDRKGARLYTLKKNGRKLKKFSRVPKKCAPHALTFLSEDHSKLGVVCEFSSKTSINVVPYHGPGNTTKVEKKIRLSRPCI